MPGLKQRSGRIAAFARGSSENKEDGGISEPQPQKVTESAARQQIANEAKITLNKNGRIADGRHLREAYDPPTVILRSSSSPPIHPQQTDTKEEGEHCDGKKRDIFAGSMLDDDFTQSGFSTPVREERSEPDHDHDRNDTYHSAKMHQRESPFKHRRRNFSRTREIMPPTYPVAERDGKLQFLLNEEDGKLDIRETFVPPGQGGFEVSDGFYRGPQFRPHKEKHHPPRRDKSASASNSRFPTREVQIRRSYPARGSVNETSREPDGVVPSRSKRGKHQEHGRILSKKSGIENFAMEEAPSDYERDDAFQDDEDLQVTPKAKRNSSIQAGVERYIKEPAPQALPKDELQPKRKRRVSSEFDDAVLGSMTLAELQRQPFDLDAAQISVRNSHNETHGSLEDRLNEYSSRSGDEQKQMFANLSLEEWEASGDWFMERFSSLMTRLRDARRDKRRMVHGFEAEAAAREATVRQRTDGIDRKLAQMKQNGQRVVNQS